MPTGMGGPALGVPPPNQQLPPQMFTTAAQLLDMTDSKDGFFSVVDDTHRAMARGASCKHKAQFRKGNITMQRRTGRRIEEIQG